jgi:hypothetical protein
MTESSENVATRFLYILSQFGGRVIPTSHETPEKIEELKTEIVNIYNSTTIEYKTSIVSQAQVPDGMCIGIDCPNKQYNSKYFCYDHYHTINNPKNNDKHFMLACLFLGITFSNILDILEHGMPADLKSKLQSINEETFRNGFMWN